MGHSAHTSGHLGLQPVPKATLPPGMLGKSTQGGESTSVHAASFCPSGPLFPALGLHLCGFSPAPHLLLSAPLGASPPPPPTSSTVRSFHLTRSHLASRSQDRCGHAQWDAWPKHRSLSGPALAESRALSRGPGPGWAGLSVPGATTALEGPSLLTPTGQVRVTPAPPARPACPTQG